MRTIPAGFLDTEVTTLQVCWIVTRRDGIQILGTEHDQDIVITTGAYAGTYDAQAGITGSDIRSTSDLSVDNLEVTGALSDTSAGDTSDTGDSSFVQILDINAADIEAGLLDNAEVTTFLVNSADPDLYQHVLRTGWIGNTVRTAEGQYKTELRGLTQALSQGIVRTYSVGCDAELFDDRCRAANEAGHTFTNSVAAVTSRRQFQVEDFVGSVILMPGGRVTWISGQNTGYVMEIKSYLSLQVELYLPMPRSIEIGDTLIMRHGCDKTRSMCINSYNNILNFRGHGVLVPGETEILRVGKR